MAIYRGPGGSGDAVNDSSSETRLAVEARDAAIAAQAAAEAAQAAAETAEANAELAETNAETAETNAETAEANAELAEANAEAAQAAAEAAQLAAETAQAAAELAETNAETAETNAETAASLAQDWAIKVSGPVSGSDYSAKYNANLAAASASAAQTAETNAETAQAAAEAARDAALSAYDNFDDRYLGPKSSDPTLDNDGNALVAGALYFNTTSGVMKVYDGSAWVAAYVSAAGVLLAVNNLSDLNNTATARTNLGLVIGTDVQAYDADTTKNDVANTFTANQIISTTSSNAALRITQLGTGNALLVEDSSNPDSTPFVVDGSGEVILGTTASTLSFSSVRPKLQIHGLTTNNSTISITDWQNNGFVGPFLNLDKSKGGAIGTRGIVSSNDRLGWFTFSGDDGVSFIPAARISADVDGTPGTNDMPGRLVFSTTADGASSPTERMRIGSDGSIGVGVTNAPTYTIRAGKNITGGTTGGNFYASGTAQSDVTGNSYGFLSEIKTAATSFVLSSAHGFRASQGTIGAGSSITNQYGFHADSSLTGATNNYGFYGNIASGTGRYNFYAAGTADNYFAGNVGIGVTTPSAKVHILTGTATGVSAGTGSRLFIDGANANNWIDIASTTTGEVGIRLGDADGVQRGRIGYQNTSDVLDFYTAGSERMRITSAGNVGIGTSSPSSRLAVNGGTSTSQIRWEVNNASYTQEVSTNAAANAYVYKSNDASYHIWKLSNSEAMRLDTSGNLGIGTTSPSTKLDVVCATNNGLKVSDGTYTGIMYPSGLGGVAVGTITNHPYIFISNNTERMRLDASGNLGIGNTAPSQRLSVVSASANSTVARLGGILYSGSQRGLTIKTFQSLGGDDCGVEFNAAEGLAGYGSFIFKADTAERMRIDSSGNLLVGTTSLAPRDFTSGGGVALQPSAAYEYATANSTVSFMNFTGSSAGSGTFIAFRQQGAARGSISTNGSTTAYNTSSDYRLKENVAPMTGALAKVALLKPCTYTWKADGSNGEGFIAHELAEVVPDAVTGEKDAVETYIDEDGNEQTRPVYQGIDTSFLVATLTAAIQEQQAIINDLKARIETLESK